MKEIIMYGTIGMAGFFLLLMGSIIYNPRIWLQDYPEVIKNRVPQKNDKENRLSLVVGIPFMALLFLLPLYGAVRFAMNTPEASFLQIFLVIIGIYNMMNLTDYVIIDLLIFCLWTPKFIRIPEERFQKKDYETYWEHTRGFFIGFGMSLVLGLVGGFVIHLLI
ncbi:MAG: hypothetical protein PQJ46_10240 [Spirochaetales bacterium]|nr:hypothetical protein [Spirochaetales bacterium]